MIRYTFVYCSKDETLSEVQGCKFVRNFVALNRSLVDLDGAVPVVADEVDVVVRQAVGLHGADLAAAAVRNFPFASRKSGNFGKKFWQFFL
jgi:hypothetical protein